jgi:hypothetical protein
MQKGLFRYPALILVLLQTAAILPFRYTQELGERDSYRMLLGLIDSLKHGSPFVSSLLYNREASFGYYAFLYALTPITGHSASTLIPAMNWIGLFSVILFVFPFYFVTERLFGRNIALSASIVLIATPVWWHCGLYGHPETTALLFFFFAMALLCRYTRRPPWPSQTGAFILVTATLTFRLDTVLLFPALIAMLCQLRKTPACDQVKEACLYTLGPLAFFFTAKLLLPRVTQGTAPPSIFALLTRLRGQQISTRAFETPWSR